MKKSTQLLIYSISILVIAIVDLITLVLNFRGGIFDSVTHEDATVQTVTNIVLGVIVGISALSILIGLYLGGKGIAESKNASGGKLHIKLAKLIAILNVILLVIVGLSLFNSTNLRSDLETAGLCLVDAILMFSYVEVAKAVRNGEK